MPPLRGAQRLRLDQFVSQAMGVSRRQARDLIRGRQVEVSGRVVREPGTAVDPADAVACHGVALALPGALYLMLHKPLGLVCATQDAHQPTVMSLLTADVARRARIVGRLDKDTSGLLLLTDDGDWLHRITSPRHACAKVYRVGLAQPLVGDAEQRLRDGIVLRNETRPSRAAAVERLAEREVLITVTEGRYHLVRRLFAALGNRVLSLHREQIGGLRLDPALPPGAWRELDMVERALAVEREIMD
jgi:16S rRNA pseudouridine516 synthase